MVVPLKVSHLVNSNFSQKETQLPVPRSLVTCWLDVSFQTFLLARGNCDCADMPNQDDGKEQVRRAQEQSHTAQEEAVRAGVSQDGNTCVKELTSGYLKQNTISMSWPRSSPSHLPCFLGGLAELSWMRKKEGEGLVVAGWWWETEWEEGVMEAWGN